MRTELINYRQKQVYTQDEWRNLDHYKIGYSDGISCSEIHGYKAANYLIKIKPQNSYEHGKKQAAIDWLANERG